MTFPFQQTDNLGKLLAPITLLFPRSGGFMTLSSPARNGARWTKVLDSQSIHGSWR